MEIMAILSGIGLGILFGGGVIYIIVKCRAKPLKQSRSDGDLTQLTQEPFGV